MAEVHKKLGRFLSLVLRHDPSAAGIELDNSGWAKVDNLLRGCLHNGVPWSRDLLEAIVFTDSKARFVFSEDGQRIRASQGHSLAVDLGHAQKTPPTRLFHGTYPAVMAAIREQGLQKMHRQHVHLSGSASVARQVGGRRGKPQILVIDAAAMTNDGHIFYLSENGVWLTDLVPPQYIEFPPRSPNQRP